ncbi:MAG: hypothetical protein KF849_17590 [Rhizobiaceae bacterium]|nr:hypothetical protein [Rhizobiaceae bacterium]
MSQSIATLAGGKPGPAVHAQAAHAQPGSLLNLIRRIQEAVDEETHGIRTDPRFDVAASNARKSRYLYDLNRAARGVGDTTLRDDHRAALADLRASLQRNEQAVLAHLNAVREVADIIHGAIRRSETDGTYSASEFSRA